MVAIDLKQKQEEMRKRYETRSVKIGHALAQLRRVTQYLEKYPGTAHVDAMKIVEKAGFDLKLERMRAVQNEDKRCLFKKREAYTS